MAHIVVLGGGLGGIPMTFELREALGADAEITLVSDSEWFQFVPSNPWVAVNWRKPEDIKVHLPPLMARRNVRFISVGADKVLPQENALQLKDGTRLTYDYLVIATGPALGYDEIEGFGPAGQTRSICHVDHAAQTAERWEAFCREPGPIVVGAVQGASCFGHLRLVRLVGIPAARIRPPVTRLLRGCTTAAVASRLAIPKPVAAAAYTSSDRAG